MKRANIAIGVLLAIASILYIWDFLLKQSLTTAGYSLESLQNQLDEIRRENLILQNKIYEESSLTHVAQSAKERGFVPAQDYIIVRQ